MERPRASFPLACMRRWRVLVPALAWIAALLFPLGAAAQAPAAPKTAAPTLPAIIELFVRDGCPHCARAEAFLAQLARERPDVSIVVRDVRSDPAALEALKRLARETRAGVPRVPAIHVGDQLILGFSEEASTGELVRNALGGRAGTGAIDGGAGACAADSGELACTAEAARPGDSYAVEFLGRTLTLEDVGLPAFTLATGLLDGFNPCSMWVLILMISLLASLNDRRRMLAVAGTFVLIQGIAYFLFMSAWLNLFLFIGLSRASQLVIAAIAVIAGVVNVKDFFAFGRGISLSIPERAKPGIYARLRAILHAENLPVALLGVVVLGILVQIVEFMCTSGFPALYTRILTLRHLDAATYYGYLLLYNVAYMLDDVIVLGIGVVTLSRARLQEREGRWLKLVSGLVMVGLGVYLAIPD